MTTQELAQQIIEINHEAVEKVQASRGETDWATILGDGLDEIVKLCWEQLEEPVKP